MSPNGILNRGVSNPTPGSLTAWLAGCTCPREANNQGAGATVIPGTPIPVFYFDARCPLHHDMEKQLEEVVGREWIDRWYDCVQKMDAQDLQPNPPPPPHPAQPVGWLKAWRWLRSRLLRATGNAH